MPRLGSAEALSDDACLTLSDVCLSRTSWIFMSPTATGSKACWAVIFWYAHSRPQRRGMQNLKREREWEVVRERI